MSTTKKPHWVHARYPELWAKRGLIWRTLAQHPEGLGATRIATLTGLRYTTVVSHLAGYNHYKPMSGVRREGYLWFATGLTKEWAQVLGTRLILHHGTISRYCVRRCKCEPCKTAWGEYQRNRRPKKKEGV
jgi:hypothetical protein